jgi:S1-C subfamily serine protease
MSALGTDLSAASAAVVETAGKSVLRVEGRRRGPSSGVAWSADGVIVAAHHNVEWDEDIAVGLPDGSTVRANVVGRDAATDVAVLRAAADVIRRELSKVSSGRTAVTAYAPSAPFVSMDREG